MNSEYLERAKLVMPGGVSSPVRAFKSVGGNPRIIKKSSGAFLIDSDDNRLIDFCMSFGPLIAGHAHPSIVKAVQSSAEHGTSYGATNEREIELAERIAKHHPAVDWVRFVSSGTEAVMSALRLARAKTNRPKVVKFEGCYHGHVDSLLVKAGSGLATFGITDSAGVPKETSEQTIVLELGNTEALDRCIEEFGEQIACIIIEGIPANNGLLIQTKEFMKYVQKKAHENGSLFILDEVITGFRLGFSGATGYYDLQPDIVTLGKVIGGGLPIGAYCGKKELMELIAPLGAMYQAGTLSGNPIAVAAGHANLDIIESSNFFSNLKQKRTEFTTELQTILTEKGYKSHIPSIESIFWIVFQEEPVHKPSELQDSAKQTFNQLHSKLLTKGVYLPPSAFEVCFLSSAHTDEVLTSALDAIKRSL